MKALLIIRKKHAAIRIQLIEDRNILAIDVGLRVSVDAEVYRDGSCPLRVERLNAGYMPPNPDMEMSMSGLPDFLPE